MSTRHRGGPTSPPRLTPPGARACSMPRPSARLMEAVAEVFVAGEMTTIVAKVEAVGPDRFHMKLALPENAFQFHRAAAVRE